MPCSFGTGEPLSVFSQNAKSFRSSMAQFSCHASQLSYSKCSSPIDLKNNCQNDRTIDAKCHSNSELRSWEFLLFFFFFEKKILKTLIFLKAHSVFPKLSSTYLFSSDNLENCECLLPKKGDLEYSKERIVLIKTSLCWLLPQEVTRPLSRTFRQHSYKHNIPL